MRLWIPSAALWWLGLYGGIGIVAMWLLRWQERKIGLDLSLRTLLRRGELGLFGLFLATSAVVDLERSNLLTQLIVANAVMLILSGLMAASEWIADYAREAEGLISQDERTWVASRKLAYLVFSMSFTTEVLLAHSAEIWRR